MIIIFGKNCLYYIKVSIDRQRGLQPLGMLPPGGGFWDGPVSQRGEELQLLLDGAVTQGPSQQLTLLVFILEAFPSVSINPMYPFGHDLNHSSVRLSLSN